MPVKPGDIVTLSMRPEIWLTKYRKLTPSASLTRTINSDAELEEMKVALQELYYQSLALELYTLNEAYDVVGDNGEVEGLIQLCKEKTANEKATVTISKPAQTPGAKAANALPPRLKVPGKAAKITA